MTKEETRQMYIAQCKICMLAEVMKVCPLCRFNIGLEPKVKPLPISNTVSTIGKEN